MDKDESFLLLKRLVDTVSKTMSENEELSYDGVIEKLKEENTLSLTDIQTLENNVGLVMYESEETDYDTSFILRRLYVNVLMQIIIFITLSMLVTLLFDLTDPVNCWATLIPFVGCYVIRFIDKGYLGDEVCRMNKLGISIHTNYLYTNVENKSDIEFINWSDVDFWYYKMFKSPKELYPILYLKSRKYPTKVIGVKTFNLYGTQALKLYCNRGRFLL